MDDTKSIFEKTKDIFRNKDIGLASELHHEDFIFVRETSMTTREEHLADLQEFFQNTNWHEIATLLYEDRNILVCRYPNEDGKFLYNVSLLKDGRYWRTMVHYEDEVGN